MPMRPLPGVQRPVTVTLTYSEAVALTDAAGRARRDAPSHPDVGLLTAAGGKLDDALGADEAYYLRAVEHVRALTRVVAAHPMPGGLSEGPAEAAYEWFCAGFAALEAEGWLAAGCYTPAAALALCDAGLIPVDAAHRPGPRATGPTVGSLLAAEDITIEQAIRLVRKYRNAAPAPRAPDLKVAGHIAAIDRMLNERDLPDFAADGTMWMDAGFFASAVRPWLDARCFTPGAARALLNAGLDATYAARLALRPDGIEDTLGFKVAAGTLAVADAIAVSAPEDAPARGTVPLPTRSFGS